MLTIAEMSHKCNVLKEKMLSMTFDIVEQKRLALKDEVNQLVYKVRAFESDISLLRTQIEEVDVDIKNQYDNDRDVIYIMIHNEIYVKRYIYI